MRGCARRVAWVVPDAPPHHVTGAGIAILGSVLHPSYLLPLFVSIRLRLWRSDCRRVTRRQGAPTCSFGPYDSFANNFILYILESELHAPLSC